METRQILLLTRIRYISCPHKPTVGKLHSISQPLIFLLTRHSESHPGPTSLLLLLPHSFQKINLLPLLPHFFLRSLLLPHFGLTIPLLHLLPHFFPRITLLPFHQGTNNLLSLQRSSTSQPKKKKMK